MSLYPKQRVALSKSGVVIGGEVVPLYSGSVHYWRLERDAWRPALVETKKLGLRFIDTYVPWGVHETSAGEADFGEIDPRLDVVAFLRLVQELGLYAIVRPGPHINAELTFYGIPERIVWDPTCQALTPQGNPVMLPMVPVGFPVPSYASTKFLEETEKWFTLVARRLSDLRYPDGPVVLLQIDNEGALYFRDGAYDQDYRPEAVALYQRFLHEKYVSRAALDRAYGRRGAPFDLVLPPTIFDAENADDLTWHLDWAEFQEHLIAGSIGRMRIALAKAGLSELPTFHNMTMGYEATPLSAEQLRRAVDLVGLDYYHRATPTERLLIERRTTELAARSAGLDQPAFACEMAAGAPPFFIPIHEEIDNRFNVMTALAYGLRAFNVYMAVDRDRWVGAPIDCHGRPRASALFWSKLARALDEVRFHELARVTPVCIVNTSLKRRLARTLHAFSPATPALFAILGQGSRETCFEEDFGLGGSVAAEGDAFIACFEEALTAEGVPFAHVDEGSMDGIAGSARWIVCATSGGIEPDLWRELRRARAGGARVTIGPRVPARDGSLRKLDEPHDGTGFELVSGGPHHPHFDRAAVDAIVSKAVGELSLVTWRTGGPVLASVHEDLAGTPRLLFLINPLSDDLRTAVDVPFPVVATDLLDRSRHESPENRLAMTVPARSVRMLKLDRA